MAVWSAFASATRFEFASFGFCNFETGTMSCGIERQGGERCFGGWVLVSCTGRCAVLWRSGSSWIVEMGSMVYEVGSEYRSAENA